MQRTKCEITCLRTITHGLAENVIYADFNRNLGTCDSDTPYKTDAAWAPVPLAIKLSTERSKYQQMRSCRFQQNK